MGVAKRILLICAFCSVGFAEDIWQKNAPVPPGGRQNLFQLSADQLRASIDRGKIHAQIYPVEVTGMLPPLRPLQDFLEKETGNPLKKVFRKLFQGFSGIHTLNDFFRWVGLHEYPREGDEGVYSVPYPEGRRPDYLMGFSPIMKAGTPGFSIGCMECHSANLFGKTVLGMTNRFPRGNHLFAIAKKVATFYNAEFFKIYEHATPQELAMMAELKSNLGSVGVKEPLTLGLDTSLAQVGLSLDRRNSDAWATKNQFFELHPRPDDLDHAPADSKPAVWWNLKYKNRWLADGSVVSGNPVFTNILWNEVGRGGDLHALKKWWDSNEEKIRDLTNAVFSVEAPRLTDFFPAEMISLPRAQHGEKLFNQMCAKCHGIYVKNWSDGASGESVTAAAAYPQLYADLLKTKLVVYTNTKVVDVGTDPWRYRGMKSLERLNSLEISRDFGTVIELQKGYVAPPLVGIWARWPYFHNNSVPSLCAVLTAGPSRPARYLAREANDPSRDFDFECNGYPAASTNDLADAKSAELADAAEKHNPYLYDSSRAGMSRLGHDEGIFLSHGQEVLSPEDKKDLIQFLQTL